MFKSVTAVLLGALISLAIGLLVVFGIVAPLFTSFVSPSLARASALPAGVLVGSGNDSSELPGYALEPNSRIDARGRITLSVQAR